MSSFLKPQERFNMETKVKCYPNRDTSRIPIQKQSTYHYKVELVPKINHKQKDGTVRILCFSDSHHRHTKIPIHMLPKCDIVICAGDFTVWGTPEETQSFCEWFSKLNAKYRIVIAGNHELSFDDYENKPMMQSNIQTLLRKTQMPIERAKEIMNEYGDDIIYLENESTEVCGLKIYGSPYTHYWKEWAFYYPDDEGPEIWSAIPPDTDILVTHTCPEYSNDLIDGKHVGCKSLTRAVERIQPCLHLFGHLHDGYGVSKIGKTVVANVSLLNQERSLANKPMIFDISKKKNNEKKIIKQKDGTVRI